ncbi:hypothetical protein [Subtercola sp. YIM 133946]|uniref:hypothetical protein n=1 Tax=Subtercola sp. YIM 133946 TaxID=3118909 RepID=UPI002F95A0D8
MTVREQASAQPRLRSRAAPILLIVVFAVIIAGSLFTNRNFWFDEAMAYQAIANEAFLAPGQPMLLFEQTMPYGVYVIFKVLVDAVGLNETVLRIPEFLAYIVGLVALYRASRVVPGTFGRLATMAAGGLAMWVVSESAMFKHYIFEYAAGALILAAGYTLLASKLRTRSVVAFLVISVVSVLFSNTAPLATGAVAISVLIIAFISDRVALRAARWKLIVAGVVYLVCFAIVYLTVIKPAALYQLSLPFYQGAGLRSLATALAGIWAPTGKPLFLLFGVAIGVVIVIGMVLSRRRGVVQWFPYLALLFTVVAMVGGTLVGLTPFSNPRHVLFATPVIGLAFGAAAQAIWVALAPLRRRSVVLRVAAGTAAAVVGVGFLGIAVYGSVNRHEEVGRLLAAGDSVCDATYVDYSFQPAAEIYIARDHLGIDLQGEVATVSGLGADSWLQKVRDNMPAYQAAAVSYFESNGPGCLLTTPTPATDDLLKPLAAAGITCTPVDKLAGVGLYRCGA